MHQVRHIDDQFNLNFQPITLHVVNDFMTFMNQSSNRFYQFNWFHWNHEPNSLYRQPIQLGLIVNL